MNSEKPSLFLIADTQAKRRLIAYLKSEARRREALIEMDEEEMLRNTDIQDIGLQSFIVASLRNKGIKNVWDLIQYDKNSLLADPKINPTGFRQIIDQLAILGLTLCERQQILSDVRVP